MDYEESVIMPEVCKPYKSDGGSYMSATTIKELICLARDHFKDDTSGHDWWHMERVWKLARRIAVEEKADVFLVEAAALLHDVADSKLNADGGESGRQLTRTWLKSLNLKDTFVDQVEAIIDAVSFKGAGVDTTPPSLEAMIVQDADRLDAMGAIGIARTFAYGGSRNRHIHDPASAPTIHQSYEEYKKNTSTTINHFYEKLLLLHDRLNTPTAKAIGKKRHAFMQTFLREFHCEWDAND